MNRECIIAREGFPFIIPLGVFAIIFAFFGFTWLAFLFFVATAFVTWFFRNPQRKIPDDIKAVVSPADGEVIKIEDILKNELLKTKSRKVSIFMNIFNVHVNRIPYSGVVEGVYYNKGNFFSADLDKASLSNERNSILIKTDDGKEILTVQIAGLIARRIECWVKEGMNVCKGERFGLIRFGSRLEVFLPSDSTVSVKVGDKVRAGETLIGWLK
ncbi:MAG TPA: phosphatidylserine decarboxylase family protein [Syntrophales bacterium]|nr:phosphatidylserine decarboxylase family protein [Syntrophales bacterium]